MAPTAADVINRLDQVVLFLPANDLAEQIRLNGRTIRQQGAAVYAHGPQGQHAGITIHKEFYSGLGDLAGQSFFAPKMT